MYFNLEEMKRAGKALSQIPRVRKKNQGHLCDAARHLSGTDSVLAIEDLPEQEVVVLEDYQVGSSFRKIVCYMRRQIVHTRIDILLPFARMVVGFGM